MPKSRSQPTVGPAQPLTPTTGAPVQPRQGLNFDVACTLDEVIAAWRLVYTSYRQADLIAPNHHHLHTTGAAVSPSAAIVIGWIGHVATSTLTAVIDSDQGLPLDRVYHDELSSMRDQGRKVLEVGLFADRRSQLGRRTEALLELMRFAFNYGCGQDVTDYVIGVHPRHARFYSRAFGFLPAGEARTYHAVNDKPVILLRGDFATRWDREGLDFPALAYFSAHPVPPQVFATRCRFTAAEMAGSLIEKYLLDQEPVPADPSDASAGAA